ncbi:MAG: hypothetical protein H7173_06890 [Rhodoferax sp.]|nr:hypothetical protein [Pseudorhodobacter sp.]
MKYVILLALLGVSACDMMGMSNNTSGKETQSQMANDDEGSADDPGTDTGGQPTK